MTPLESVTALSGVGCFLGGVAAWAQLWSPWAKNKKAQNNEDRRLKRETHEALYGIPERRDDSGAVIKPAQPGLLAEFRVQQKDLRSLKAEFPVNGVPARVAIDVLNQNLHDMRTEIKSVGSKIDSVDDKVEKVITEREEDKRVWIEALAAKGIDIPQS